MSVYVLAFLIGVIAGLAFDDRAGRGQLGGAAGDGCTWKTPGWPFWDSRPRLTF